MKRIATLLAFFVLFLFTKPVYADTLTFVISNAQVNGEDITFDATITNLASTSCPDGKCYLQGGIRKGSGDYFGFTKNNSGELVGYVSSPDVSFISGKFLYCTVAGTSCSTSVSMHFNHDDKKYKDYGGPGEYSITLKRYSGISKTGYDSDNSLTINLDVATPTPSATASPTPSSTPTVTATATPTPTKTSTPKPTPHKYSTYMGGSPDTPTPTAAANVAEERALLATPSPTPAVLGAANGGSGGTDSGNSVPTIAILFVAGGLVMVAIAGVSILQSRYNSRTAGQNPSP